MRQIKDLLQHRFAPYLGIVALAAFCTILWELRFSESPPAPGKPEDVRTADTYIPAGYVLVPVAIANQDALHSLLGEHGVVDFFLPAKEPHEKPVRLAEQVKILRAPRNRHQFAALAPENLASRFARLNEPLFAVVKNPLHNTAIKRTEEKQKQRRIYVSVSDEEEAEE